MNGKHSREITVAGALALLLLALGILAPNFYDLQPLLSRTTSQMPALVAAIGITLVIITRQIDISIGAQFSMCGVVAGVVAAAGFPLPVAVLAAVGTGVVMGAFNGVLIAWLGLPSIVVTLATMVTWNELLRLWQQGRLMTLPDGFQWFGLSQATGQGIVIAVAVALLVSAAWTMKHLAAGRHVYAVGTDAEAARLAGINPKWTTFGVFVLMGALAGIASVLNLVQSPQVQPNAGDGLELKVIAAAVVGGVAITGGRGNLWGVLLGLLLLANVNPALTHFHQPPYWERAIQGLVILLAVVADGMKRTKKATA
ncbi:ABC transporter permease [Luteolibacter flavescens]|uniref:Autoinducer 2 import system permease protein LsrC n=1 Tax=Luteolibacter flavescens TaxID=1859460 RepID=A0ABT3FLE3_9BACT|nr:ABC transporter permease [Luteolibacter flavescens]MCW1883795.1 ABC transporter permease [Luteolibacter flavescens]